MIWSRVRVCRDNQQEDGFIFGQYPCGLESIFYASIAISSMFGSCFYFKTFSWKDLNWPECVLKGEERDQTHIPTSHSLLLTHAVRSIFSPIWLAVPQFVSDALSSAGLRMHSFCHSLGLCNVCLRPRWKDLHSPSCPGVVVQMRCSLMTLIEHCTDTCLRKIIGFVYVSHPELLLKGDLISFTRSVMPVGSAREVQIN